MLDPLLDEMLGYLNFSSGSPDPRFRHHVDEAYRAIEGSHPPATEPWQALGRLLAARLEQLRATGGEAFRDTRQAAAVVELAFNRLPNAYRRFHRDLLQHQQERTLFGSFFLAKACEAILATGGPWDDGDPLVAVAISRLNDFLGYRPVAVLHSRQKMEPYAHEWVCPLPLSWKDVGVEHGPHHGLIERTLAVLRATDDEILEAAAFDLDRLDELALDPRAYDFDHPVNKRPNYHFGQWDPHRIDRQGQYRRFVLQAVTLDAIQRRAGEPSELPVGERQVEAATVLAGTMLMASALSGRGPDAHDSTMTLARLVPKIAALRDKFYEHWLGRIEGAHGKRLCDEATRLRQAFGGARQHLNRYLARLRAAQLEHVHLAHLFATMGYAQAAARQAQVVPVASARMTCEITSRLQAAYQLARRGEFGALDAPLDDADDLLHRGIECGALVDPWNILGFQGQFSLFPAVENSVRDHRVDALIELVRQMCDLLVYVTAQAAAAGQQDVERRTIERLARMAGWWDQFGSIEIESLERLSGAEALEAARHVAAALGARQRATVAAGDIAFWRGQIAHLQSPRVCGLVIQTLLGKGDLVAARALLAHWLGQADQIPLADGDHSLHNLAYTWLRRALAVDGAAAERWSAVLKFFDYLEAAAETWWSVPRFELQGEAPADNEEEEADDDDDNPYAAAYDDVIYRDTTADGVEGSMLESGAPPTDLEWDAEAERLTTHLALLTTIARLWQSSALAPVVVSIDSREETLRSWFEAARRNSAELAGLLNAVVAYRLPLAGASHELMVEYDRRRMAKDALLGQIMVTRVETVQAERFLLAALDPPATLERGDADVADTDWLAARLLSALASGDLAEAKIRFAALCATLDAQPILYVPLMRGGDPRQVVAAQSLYRLLHGLVRQLPRAGMIVEACQVLATAQAMERHRPKREGVVTEFDRLFEAGYKAIVATLVAAAPTAESADEELTDALELITESLLRLWLAHQRLLRLSVLEKLHADDAWQATRRFIERWGHEIFTPRFMNLGNLRSVLHGGVAVYLERLEEEGSDEWALLTALDADVPRAEAAQRLTTILEAVVENYSEYKDYNATTTQSDRGELLYVLLDFLRLKASYERFAWTIRPVLLAHEVLVRNGRAAAAERWRRGTASRTSEAADWHLRRLDDLVKEHGVVLATVADRLRERFVRPLATDRLCALVFPAVHEQRTGENSAAFETLEREANEAAEAPTGAGLDMPEWLAALEEESQRVLASWGESETIEDDAIELPTAAVTWEDLSAQLRSLDALP